ncbi:unnamed protein product [Allacma fusca]|uniref:Uncharacterized protein n=1 Tax=Allacma fusca TaxID=39272 RepID=A0A8J2KWE1_9HEXA|nr:unnamed protein product [Allacma fusca]
MDNGPPASSEKTLWCGLLTSHCLFFCLLPFWLLGCLSGLRNYELQISKYFSRGSIFPVIVTLYLSTSNSFQVHPSNRNFVRTEILRERTLHWC